MRRPLLLVCAAAFLYMLGLSVLFPVLGTFIRDLSLTETQAGMLVSIYALASFFMAPVWGWVSQRYGRKPPILVGLVGFSVAFLAFGLGSGFWELFAARLAGGMLAAAVLPAIFAYVADTVPRERRSVWMGALGAAIGCGVFGGVIVGGVLGEVSARLPFLTTAGIGGVTALGVALLLPESLTAQVREELRVHQQALDEQGLTRLRLVTGLSPFLLYAFLVQAARSGLEIVIGFLVIDRFAGGSGETAVVLGLGTAAGVLVQGGLVRVLSRRYDDRALMLFGTGLLAVGLFAVGAVETWSVLLVASAVLGAGAGLIEPTFRAELARSAEAVQGEAQGLHSSAQSLARGLAFLAFPALYQRLDPIAVFAVAAVTCLVALAIARGGLRPAVLDLDVRATAEGTGATLPDRP